jgi:Mn2+/Fe2+ NRAMP family transporter
VLQTTVAPTLPSSPEELATAMAVLGTTVSPYLVVWQAEGEREAHRSPPQFKMAEMDITTGYVISNVVSYFIIVTTAATLFVHHRSIQTAADAATTLQPLVGSQASVVFGIGLLAAALTAIPMFAISTGFLISEVLGWPAGLSKTIGEAPRFYAVLALAFLSGAVATLLGVDPIVMLFDSQVLNGLLMPVLIVVLALLVNDSRVMGEHRSTLYYNVWLAVSLLVLAGGALLLLRSLI